MKGLDQMNSKVLPALKLYDSISQAQVTVQIPRKRTQESNKIARTIGEKKKVLPGWTWRVFDS